MNSSFSKTYKELSSFQILYSLKNSLKILKLCNYIIRIICIFHRVICNLRIYYLSDNLELFNNQPCDYGFYDVHLYKKIRIHKILNFKDKLMKIQQFFLFLYLFNISLIQKKEQTIVMAMIIIMCLRIFCFLAFLFYSLYHILNKGKKAWN